MKVRWCGGFFLIFFVFGMPLTFLLLLSLGDAFLDLDFGLGYEGKVVWGILFCLWNAINVPFAVFL